MTFVAGTLHFRTTVDLLVHTRRRRYHTRDYNLHLLLHPVRETQVYEDR